MALDNSKPDLSPQAQKIIELMKSKRGLQSQLAKSINKTSSYFSEIKRGNPVNFLHLRAVGLVCGKTKVLELLGIDNEMEQHPEMDGSFDKKNGPGVLNADVLRQVIEGVDVGLEKETLSLPADKKAALIIILYEYFTGTGRTVNEEEVLRYLKLVA